MRRVQTGPDLYWKRATTNYPVEALIVFAGKRDQLRFVSGVEGFHHLLGLGGRKTECRPDQANAPPNAFPVDCGYGAGVHHAGPKAGHSRRRSARLADLRVMTSASFCTAARARRPRIGSWLSLPNVSSG